MAGPLLNTLLDVLECLPLLQELTLSRAISSDLSSLLRSTQIRLVDLQRLHLHGDFVACFEFLSWVDFPKTTSLNFSWTSSGEIALLVINSSLMRELLKPHLSELRCDSLELTALPHEVELKCSHTMHPQDFHFKCDIQSSTTTQTLTGICNIIVALFKLPIPLQTITTFSIDISLSSPLSESAWSQIMSKFQVLRELSCCPPPPGLLGCLVVNAERAITGHEALLLPDLVCITFQGVLGEQHYYQALKCLHRKIKWKSP
jgi:hypothetical protein